METKLESEEEFLRRSIKERFAEHGLCVHYKNNLDEVDS